MCMEQWFIKLLYTPLTPKPLCFNATLLLSVRSLLDGQRCCLMPAVSMIETVPSIFPFSGGVTLPFCTF